MKKAIVVDWLSVYCNSSLLVHAQAYSFQRQAAGSAQFKDVYIVYDRQDNEQYCTVQCNPYSPIIPKQAVMVKVANRYLYRTDWNARLNNFFLACNLTPISISRIDIACDFNHFDNNLQVQNFISGFLSNKYIKMGQNKYTLMGEQKDQHYYSYLRFGNRESEISTYLYNKSQELREVKDKPYIREMWKNSGIDTNKDVWRLEVSLRTVQMRTVIKQTGEEFRLDLDFFKTQGILENVYNCAILKAYDFRINDGQKQKRRMKKLELFKGMSSTLLMYVPTNEACTNRMDKIIVKKIANYYSQYRIDNQEDIDNIQKALEAILYASDLWEYYYMKVRPSIDMFKER